MVSAKNKQRTEVSDSIQRAQEVTTVRRMFARLSDARLSCRTSGRHRSLQQTDGGNTRTGQWSATRDLS
jgi:hypothetical protein